MSIRMHDFLIKAVFALGDSLRDAALELDLEGDGEIILNDGKEFLKLLQRELPEVTLTSDECKGLASAFQGNSPGSLIIENFIYSCEQTAFLSLNEQEPSRQQKDYERYEISKNNAEKGRDDLHSRVISAPSNTPISNLLHAIQRKLRTRTSGMYCVCVCVYLYLYVFEGL
jgi:hypothetical protein